jgi:GGDEF domain-containing protein
MVRRAKNIFPPQGRTDAKVYWRVLCPTCLNQFEVGVNSDSTHIPVSILSTDTTALSELTWTLKSYGYPVVASSDWTASSAAQRTGSSSLVVLDARDDKQIRDALAAQRATPYVYRIAIYDEKSLANSDSLMDLGVDDLVRYPINVGELLTCIRRGARRLEFEQRFRDSTTFDLQAGILSRRGLARQLQRKIESDNTATLDTLIVLGIDHLQTIRAQHGFCALEYANSLLVESFQNELANEDLRAVLHEGVYALLLHGQGVDQAIQYTHDIIHQISDLSSVRNAEYPRLTASAVVVDWSSCDHAEQTISRAETAFDFLSAFGGNQIFSLNEVEKKHATWKQKFSSNQGLHAQHIMETFPLVLPINAATPMNRSSLGIFSLTSSKSLPHCIPIVDVGGSLLGVVESESFRQHGNEVFHSLTEHLDPSPDTVKATSGMDEIAASLESSDSDYLLVVENKKPIGYITSQTYAAIGSTVPGEPYNRDLAKADCGLSSLVVPLI